MTSSLSPSQSQPQTNNPPVYFSVWLFWSCCSPHLGFDLPSRDQQRAPSVILVPSSRSREKINLLIYWFINLFCVCCSVELLFLLKHFLSGIKSGTLCPRVNTKFLLSPPQNHLRIMDPLDSKKYLGATKFLILFSILHQPPLAFCHQKGSFWSGN